MLSPDWEPLSVQRAEPLHPAVDEVALGSFRRRQPPQIVGSGYIVRSLEAAIWAFHNAADFREAVLRAVNVGDDSDTTGAVCGQLAGACGVKAAGCWLLRHGHATSTNVLKVLMELRQQDRQRRHRMSPESAEQQRFVKHWLDHESGPRHNCS